VFYKQIDLLDNGDFDFDGIKKALCRQKIKLASIQRSKGYENRRSFSVAEIKKLISFIKYINPQVICMVDNCYGEFVETSEPPADLCVGSLIKNPGGGLAPCGGYIAGRADLVEASAIQLTAPGLGKEIGPSLNANPQILHGLFLAPQVAAAALKGAAFAAKICARAGFSPDPGGELADIVTRVELKTPERVIAFCEGIQSASPVDSFAAPVPADMPGYDSKIIMAAGAFISGSSIELSADAPMREPYAVYLQGGLNYHHAKLGILNALSAIRALEQA
jgi:cystathionine beta-lyase family protein involved in aluminum resistance